MVEAESQTQRFLDQLTLIRGRKHPHRITVRIYPAKSDENEGKPYVARDLQGNEVKLQLAERVEVEQRLFGTADAADVRKLQLQEKIIRQKVARKIK